jgi:hypothetical protein
MPAVPTPISKVQRTSPVKEVRHPWLRPRLCAARSMAGCNPDRRPSTRRSARHFIHFRARPRRSHGAKTLGSKKSTPTAWIPSKFFGLRLRWARFAPTFICSVVSLKIAAVKKVVWPHQLLATNQIQFSEYSLCTSHSPKGRIYRAVLQV